MTKKKGIEAARAHRIHAINQEAQMLPQAQYFVRLQRELDRDEKIHKHNLFAKRIAWATLAVAVITLVATIIGWFIK